MHFTICDFLLDVIQNAIEADSTVIETALRETEDSIICTVTDNGIGMTKEEVARIRDPFFTDGKKHIGRVVGLGIPFLVQTADSVDGNVVIESEKGNGTVCRFRFSKNHIDCPPLGDVPGTFFAACTYPGDFEMVLTRSLELSNMVDSGAEHRSYEIVKSEISDAVGGFDSVGNLKLIRDFIKSQEDDLGE